MVNQSLAMNPAKTKRFGNLFHTIDFDTKGATRLNMGTLYIGSKAFKLTHEELIQLQLEADQKNAADNLVLIQGWEFTLTKHETSHLADTLRRGEDIAFKLNRIGS